MLVLAVALGAFCEGPKIGPPRLKCVERCEQGEVGPVNCVCD